MNSLSRVRLFATPWTVAYKVPLSMEFSRQEYWSGLPFLSPGDLPHPKIKPGSSTLQADALPSEPPGKSLRILEWVAIPFSRGWGQSGCNCLDLLFRSHEHVLPSESCNTLHLILLCEMQVLSSLGLKGLPESTESGHDAGDLGSIPGSGRSPGEGHGNPLQYPCLENSMDRGAWWAPARGLAKIQTLLSH